MPKIKRNMTRVTLDLEERDYRSLGKFEELYEEPKARVIRSLIRREKQLLKMIQDGGKIVCQKKDGSEATIVALEWVQFMA